MPIESRSNSALFRRAEQLKRWEDSETNNVPSSLPKDKNIKIKFSDGCVFLAACAASDTEEVERLISQGTDINTANVDGLTALHQACIDNNLDMVQFLVEKGCDVNRGDNEGWTPLHATASCGFLSIAKYLIEHGANVAAVNNDGDLPIDISDDVEMEEYLTDVLDEKDIDCDEARCEEERIMLEDAKLMLGSSLDINEKIHPRTGATPLHVAAAKGYLEVLKVLIEAGADLNAQDNDGWTPLHAGAHWCQKEICAMLADNLANMDIQNFAGQTCFDVADPDTVKLLEELKKKQASMQKERPEIQAILQRTSTRAPLKRRTSVTRMSGQEKSKSVMKDTKAERAQIENLTLVEEENDDDKGKSARIEVTEPPLKKEPEVERIPSWKKVLRRSSEESANADSTVPEVILKRPKKLSDKSEKDEDAIKEGRPSIPSGRDDESELQRKAHAKRVRETRRSTQGVLLEDIKSAELQYLISTQQEAAVRQAEELKNDKGLSTCKKEDSNADTQDGTLKTSKKHTTDSKETDDSVNHVEKSILGSKSDTGSKSSVSSSDAPSVTLVLKPKPSSSPEDTSPSDGRTSLGTQAAIQRRKRPKRRSTGVVYLDSDDAQEEKENASDKDSNIAAETSISERSRQRYGSSVSLPDSDVSSKSDTSSRYSSRASLLEEDKDYKKLYEEVKKDNDRLKEELKKSEDELEKAKKQIQKFSQSTSIKNSISEAEKKEKRTLERRLSEMEEEIKQNEKLMVDNKRLKEENAALIRVISKLSQ